eukprot:gene37271-45250_t
MSNFRSLNDLKKQEEEDSKRNEYFAGGLDQRGGGSGLAVVGPPSDPNRNRNILDQIVQKAVQGSQDGLPPSVREGAQAVEITLYRNGFTVDSGPLRDLNSPESRDFLTSLERGQIPRELFTTHATNIDALDVKLRDKRSEDFASPPAPAYVAFSGQALTLGARSSAGGEVFTAEVLRSVDVSSAIGEPTTTVALRTHDNKRLRIKVSQHASVLQLAALVWRESGCAADASFSLNGGYPPKDLADSEVTIGAAGLGGSSLTQIKH